MRNLYFTFIYPYLIYCIEIWGLCSFRSINQSCMCICTYMCMCIYVCMLLHCVTTPHCSSAICNGSYRIVYKLNCFFKSKINNIWIKYRHLLSLLCFLLPYIVFLCLFSFTCSYIYIFVVGLFGEIKSSYQ